MVEYFVCDRADKECFGKTACNHSGPHTPEDCGDNDLCTEQGICFRKGVACKCVAVKKESSNG